MTDATAEAAPKGSTKKKLIPAALAVLLAGAGFASTYLGFWSPAALLGPAPAPKTALPENVFVAVPTIELPIAGAGRSVILSASIETDDAYRGNVDYLMPRILDAFTTFLAGIDEAAFDKRGVLEIIRAELLTRARYVLGAEAAKDLLVTEFRFK